MAGEHLPHMSEEWLLAQVGINPDRSFGPNYRIVDGRAHHVNERPGESGVAAVFVDGKWRLGRGEK